MNFNKTFHPIHRGWSNYIPFNPTSTHAQLQALNRGGALPQASMRKLEKEYSNKLPWLALFCTRTPQLVLLRALFSGKRGNSVYDFPFHFGQKPKKKKSAECKSNDQRLWRRRLILNRAFLRFSLPITLEWPGSSENFQNATFFEQSKVDRAHRGKFYPTFQSQKRHAFLAIRKLWKKKRPHRN